MLEKIKAIGNNARPYLTCLIMCILVYNIIIVPVLAANGIPAPILVIDEATRFLLMISSMGG